MDFEFQLLRSRESPFQEVVRPLRRDLESGDTRAFAMGGPDELTNLERAHLPARMRTGLSFVEMLRSAFDVEKAGSGHNFKMGPRRYQAVTSELFASTQ